MMAYVLINTEIGSESEVLDAIRKIKKAIISLFSISVSKITRKIGTRIILTTVIKFAIVILKDNIL